MNDAPPLVSVIVVSFNTRALLHTCLASVARLELPHELVVVDNASSDGSADMVAQAFPQAVLLRQSTNEGFGRANNAGMALARGDVFVLLNSDARLLDGRLALLIERVRAQPRIGIVGPRLRYPDGRLQPSAYRFGSLGLMALEEWGLYKLLPRARRAELLLGGYWDHGRERTVDWLVGACLVVRREVYTRTAGFDPSLFLYGEEVEWCRRVHAAGFEVLYAPLAEIEHVGHASAHEALGASGRLDRCLIAADRLTARWEGPLAAALAAWVRASGALLKLVAFGLRRLVRGDDAHGREVLWTARAVLNHHWRRVRGRLALDTGAPTTPGAV